MTWHHRFLFPFVSFLLLVSQFQECNANSGSVIDENQVVCSNDELSNTSNHACRPKSNAATKTNHSDSSLTGIDITATIVDEASKSVEVNPDGSVVMEEDDSNDDDEEDGENEEEDEAEDDEAEDDEDAEDEDEEEVCENRQGETDDDNDDEDNDYDDYSFYEGDDDGDDDDDEDDEDYEYSNEENVEYDWVEYDDSFLAINTWGKPQIVEGSEEEREEIVQDIEKSAEYMNSKVFKEEEYEKIRPYCRNHDVMCSVWATAGECEMNKEWMVENCSPACMTCSDLEEVFDFDSEEGKDGEPPSIEIEQGKVVPIPWGIPQNLDGQSPGKVRELMDKTAEYMTETVYMSEEFENVYADCENRHEHCSSWAALGQCDENPDYMKVYCAPACLSCHYLDPNLKCPVAPDEYVAWPNPGDVNRFFERIVNDTYWEENHGPVTVISSPATGGPWVITIEKFLSHEEADRLVEFGYQEGYERSTDVGEPGFDGTQTKVESTWRTSQNSWCPDECKTDPVTGPVHDRVEKLTGIPYNNAEWWQLLRYEPQQRYKEHHDYISYERHKPQGPRILTGFFYLNDVEAGGGTRFTKLDITIMPKKGQALLWPSVRDDKPMRRDGRTMHEALPVEEGIKYGANVWFHQRNFKERYDGGCI